VKKCPFCAEEIQDEAIKCKHCGSMLGGLHAGEMCLNGACTGTIGVDGKCKVCGQAQPASHATLGKVKVKKPTPSWLVAVCIIGGLGGIGAVIIGLSWWEAPERAMCRKIVEREGADAVTDLKCELQRTGPTTLKGTLRGRALGIMPFTKTCEVIESSDHGSYRWQCQ
jgi:hypothetical protein